MNKLKVIGYIIGGIVIGAASILGYIVYNLRNLTISG